MVIAATVMAGELSLISALSAGHLVLAPMQFHPKADAQKEGKEEELSKALIKHEDLNRSHEAMASEIQATAAEKARLEAEHSALRTEHAVLRTDHEEVIKEGLSQQKQLHHVEKQYAILCTEHEQLQTAHVDALQDGKSKTDEVLRLRETIRELQNDKVAATQEAFRDVSTGQDAIISEDEVAAAVHCLRAGGHGSTADSLLQLVLAAEEPSPQKHAVLRTDEKIAQLPPVPTRQGVKAAGQSAQDESCQACVVS